MKGIWLRNELKAGERRAALTPVLAKELLEKGVPIVVEKSPLRIFADQEYHDVGCQLAPINSWTSCDPKKFIILGLKEIEPEFAAFKHDHIYFAHVYKEQVGWQTVLKNYQKNGGRLYDLEYLVDEQSRRIAAFGSWAGFVGAGLAIDIYCQESKPRYQLQDYFESKKSFISHLNQRLTNLAPPKAMVIGAKGRSGSGAVQLFNELGIQTTQWDAEETAVGGPFTEILDHEIFVNCVFINKKVPPFLTPKLLTKNKKLRVISDVSCDPTGPFNPLPLYDSITTMKEPLRKINNEVYLMAIDHLPSILPRESSQSFANDFFPHLLNFLANEKDPVWNRAYELFKEKCELV